MKHLVEHDRGLGTAYERYCFYQLLDKWAADFGVETFLEGPFDGMAGVAGVHGIGLARRGVRVTTALPTDEHARIAQAVYDTSAAPVTTIVSGDDLESIAKLPKSDMVLTYHALSFVDDWRTYLKAAASLAKKVLVVTVCNPDNWGVSVVRAFGRLRRARGVEPPESWKTEVLAPELWALGQVKEHAYFDCPWWPDLQVSPGQSLTDRIKRMSRAKDFQFTDTPEESVLASKFVYGDGRWPYFGGTGWVDELMPALLAHPCFEGARSTRIRRRTSHLHAFVVDTRPRTPRQRRVLAQAERGG